MHSGHSDDGGETASVAEETILKHLKQTTGSWDKAEIFMKYIKNRAGLLISQKPGYYTFPHRTFQEFMAAAHLVEYREENKDYVSESVRLVAEDPEKWRVVFVLAARWKRRKKSCPKTNRKAAAWSGH